MTRSSCFPWTIWMACLSERVISSPGTEDSIDNAQDYIVKIISYDGLFALLWPICPGPMVWGRDGA